MFRNKAKKIAVIMLTVTFLLIYPITQLGNVHATHTSTNIVVSNLAASFPSVGPGSWSWTPSGSTPGRLFIGTNATDPIVGAITSYAINTSDGFLADAGPYNSGVYYGAMYTGAFGEILMSNIARFTIGSAGGITLNKPNVSGSTVIFTFTPSDGSFVVIADTICPAMLSLPRPYDSKQIAPGVTQVDWFNAPNGNYCAKIIKALSGATLSNVVSFAVGGKTWKDPASPPPPFNIMDVFQPAKRFGSFGQLASDALLILVSLAGALAVIFIMISGFKFVTSSGDEKKLASARATLTYAIIGIAVVILAFVIVQILQYFLQSSVPIT